MVVQTKERFTDRILLVRPPLVSFCHGTLRNMSFCLIASSLQKYLSALTNEIISQLNYTKIKPLCKGLSALMTFSLMIFVEEPFR
jgi:hypothetical protein